jgi:hypothetical protein
LVIVFVAFLAILYRDVPTQPIAKDSSAQAEHLFEQISMLFGTMRLNDNDHDENCLLVLRSGTLVPSATPIVADSRAEVSGSLRK